MQKGPASSLVFLYSIDPSHFLDELNRRVGTLGFNMDLYYRCVSKILANRKFQRVPMGSASTPSVEQ